MSDRIRVAIDLDNTTGSYIHAFRASVANQMGVDPATLTLDPDWNFTEWNIQDRFAELHHHAVSVDRIFRYMKVMAGASEAIERIDADLDAHISIVTSRLCVPGIHEVAIADTVAWLDSRKIRYHELHALKGRGLSKTETVRFDVLIDDKPAEVLAARQAGKVGIIFGDYSYNRDVPGPRVTHWDEIPSLLSGMLARS